MNLDPTDNSKLDSSTWFWPTAGLLSGPSKPLVLDSFGDWAAHLAGEAPHLV